MKKKIFATLLVTAMLSLTACGAKATESDLDYIVGYVNRGLA